MAVLLSSARSGTKVVNAEPNGAVEVKLNIYMSATMQEMLGKGMKAFTEGSIVKGKILEKRASEVLIDIGYKSEGSISLSEFEDPDSLKVGDEIEVLLERLENDEGMVVLSKEKAAQKQNWEKIVKIFNEGGLITGKVKAV